jgi:thiosulfate dehydrogenase
MKIFMLLKNFLKAKLRVTANIVVVSIALFCSCSNMEPVTDRTTKENLEFPQADTLSLGNDSFDLAVKYGRNLLLNTAFYIGPQGQNGQYTGNKLNCTSCHQQAGTKPFSFNLMRSHDVYPQYRAREGKILSLADRVNNCIMRPHNGKPLSNNSREMIAILSYLKWINSFMPDSVVAGEKNLPVIFPKQAANPQKGGILYAKHCSSCHGKSGEGISDSMNIAFLYPALWGPQSYQSGSSMHRIIKMSQWLKANMPYGISTAQKPLLTDEEYFDIAAFINDDRIHLRPDTKNFDYPIAAEKAIDYAKPPFADTFSIAQHKFGPYTPILEYWKKNGLKATF